LWWWWGSFHGDGWPSKHEGNHKYQTGIYADVKAAHNREYITTTASIASGFHTYGLYWAPDKVVWTFDGKVVREVKDQSIVPQIKMKARLHSRSGYCDKMTRGASFTASFLSFTYEPVAGF